MTHPAVNSEQVEALFAERQQYESWLATLESRRSATPAHIYDRVRADYAARLQRVVEQLASYRAVMQEMESGLMDRLTTLDIEDAKHRDEQAEADLRATVGEVAAEQHREIRARTDSALAAIAEARAQVTEELSRVRAMLATGAPAVPPPAVVPAAAPVAAPPPPAATAAATVAPPRPASRPEFTGPRRAPVRADPSRDRTGDVQLPLGRGDLGTRAPAAAPAAESAAPTGRFDDLEFLKTMIEPRPSSGEGVAVTSGAPTAASGAASVVSGSAESVASSIPLVGHAPEENTAPRESAAEQVKTLKCQECGTLNYPTEWYCERCGAELAAL